MNEIPFDRLNGEERKAYFRAIQMSHQEDLYINCYDQDEKFKGRLDPRDYLVIDGQVDWDLQGVRSEITSHLVISPREGLGLADAILGPFHPAKYIEVVVLVQVVELDAWVSCEVFYGLPDKTEEDDTTGFLLVTGYGKESLMQAPNSSPRGLAQSIPNGKRRTFRVDDFVRRVAEQFGETKFKFGPTNGKNKINPSKTKFDNWVKKKGVWGYFKKQVKELAFLMYYDRAGWLTLRDTAKEEDQAYVHEANTEWTFSAYNFIADGVRFPSNVVTASGTAFDGAQYKNRVDVWGKRTRSAKTPVLLASYRYARPQDFGSVTDMARNDVKRELTKVIRHGGVLKPAKARRIAMTELDRAGKLSSEVEFTAFTVYHLQPHSTLRLMLPGQPAIYFIPPKLSIPLKPGALMTVGFNEWFSVLPDRVPQKVKIKKPKKGGKK